VSPAARRYGVRLTSPFRGVVEVVQVEAARALSDDGRHWEVQVLAPLPEHSWHSPNRHRPVLRWLTFGTWNRQQGLRRVPMSPLFDIDALQTASASLLGQMPGLTQGLPFPLEDRHELWLPDRQGRPLALLATALDGEDLEGLRPGAWTATALSEHGFCSPSLLRRGIPMREGPDPRRHASELERLVHARAGRPLQLVMEAEGTGGLSGEPQGRSALPPLPLTSDWPDQEAALVQDYLDWCAPWLLALPDLPDALRDRLEHAARARPALVERQHRLYPKVLHPDLLRTIRVEAQLRHANPIH
jgi:hypothetical protein